MTIRHRIVVLLGLLSVALGCATHRVAAQQEPAREGRLLGGRLFAAGSPAVNMGGWSDELVFRGWHIQHHLVIGHYRLVDPNGSRQAFGSYETCLQAFEKAKQTHQLQPLPKHVVLVLHGLGATSDYMNSMAEYLERQGNLTVENITYASTLEDIAAYAQSLDAVVRHLDGAETVDFVAHSMGNIVVRRYLGDLSRLTPAMRPPVKFGRMVMISPPNHGAEIADVVKDYPVIDTIANTVAGKAVEELAPSRGWPELEKTLKTPDFPFGIIAGGQGDDSGYLPQVPGDDDMLLSVDTMKLAGAVDFVQVHGIHQMMPRIEEVQELTLKFLENGFFTTAEERQPVVAAAAVP